MTETEAITVVRVTCLSALAAEYLEGPPVALDPRCFPIHTEAFLTWLQARLLAFGVPQSVLDEAESQAQELLTTRRAEFHWALSQQNAMENRQSRHQRN